MTLLEPEILGARVPRVRVVPDGDPHPKWGEAMELLDRVGICLDPWQLDILEASMLRRGDVWAAFTVAVCCPRQNGKNEILQARELIGALVLGEELIIHSAHLADTCMEAFVRFDDLIDGSDWLQDRVQHVRRTNGRETVQFANGSRVRFRTRTRGGGRGFSGSPVVFDEPMFFPVISQNAILPVMSAQPDPQAWYTGSAVDQRDHQDGVVFARVRERALAGEDDRLAYFEWSLDYDDPDEVPDHVAADPSSWAATNPALGIRITPGYVSAERLELSPRGYAVERLGVGDWPATDGVETVIPLSDWDELGAEGSIVGAYALAVDVSPERHTAIWAAGMTAEGEMRIEKRQHEQGTGWVAEYLLGELERDGGLIEAVAIDGVGPSASLVKSLRDQGITLLEMNIPEHGQACGRFIDFVAEQDLEHDEDQAMRDAIRGAATRPLGDAWAWSRKNSSVDISPLVAATLALGAASGVGAGLQVF